MWSRGINKEVIFIDDDDRAKFLAILETVLSDAGAYLITWVLLSNHFHLVIRVGARVSLAAIMHRALSWYGTYLRARHLGVGYVFQNRYGSKVVDTDEYWIAVVIYVNLNLIEAKIVSSLEELEHHPWSGYAALMGRRPPLRVHDVGEALAHFGSEPSPARRELACAMRAQIAEDGTVTPPAIVFDAMLTVGEGNDSTRAAEGRARAGNGAVEWDAAVATLAERAAVSIHELRAPVYRRPVVGARAALVYYGVTRLGLHAAEAGRRLGLSKSATSRALRNGRRRLELLAPELLE